MIIRLIIIVFIYSLFLQLLFAQTIDSTKKADPIITINDCYPASMKIPVVASPGIWRDPSQPLNFRVQDLINRMTPAEKIAQLIADGPAVPRLGIPSFSYRNECLHGVSTKVGFTTVFPQVIGMAASWDKELIHDVADAISTEARAHFNNYTSKHEGNSIGHEGISFYTPNINIFRDPRWGRGQETYGEDPFLTSKLGVAFIKGLQGDNPKYLKTAACAKHFVAYSGPEPQRRACNVTSTKRDLYNTYFPAFEAAVNEGKVSSVMGAYYALNGVPDCANPFLLKKVLRKQWGFKGFVVSDGGATRNIWMFHKYVDTPEEAVATAVKAGCNLFSGTIAAPPPGKKLELGYNALCRVLQKKLLSESEIDSAISKPLSIKFRLGLFDPPPIVPWSKIGMNQNDTPEHRALALKAARESIVLLKNNGILPLDLAKIKRIALIGPNADSKSMLLANYHGTPSHVVTILKGIESAAGSEIKILYNSGCPLALKNDSSNKPTPEIINKVVELANMADVIIFISGIDASLERENHSVPYQGFKGGDRTQIELPSVQENLLKKLYATGKPVVLVNCTGSAVALNWENENLPAIIQAWYPGEEGGTAVAEVLFGEYNPAGRLPITFYKSEKQLPPFENYNMKGRTYRYFEDEPLYPFGFGLSYTSFDYIDLAVDKETAMPTDTVTIMVKVKNVGDKNGEEVVQLYVKSFSGVELKDNGLKPIKSLKGFQRVSIKKGDTKTVKIALPVQSLKYYDEKKDKLVLDSGKYELQIGSSSRDIWLKKSITVQ